MRYGCFIGLFCGLCAIGLFVASYGTAFMATTDEEAGRASMFLVLGIVALIVGLIFTIIGFFCEKPKQPVESRDELKQNVKKPEQYTTGVRKYSSLEGEGTKGKIHWYCSKCDAEVSEIDKTCPKCGVEFE